MNIIELNILLKAIYDPDGESQIENLLSSIVDSVFITRISEKSFKTQIYIK